MIALLKQFIFSIIAPPFCVQCQVFLEEDNFLCNGCLGSFMPIATKTLSFTKKYSAKVFAVTEYIEPLRSLVLAKQSGNRLAAKQLGQLMWQRTDLRFADFDIIVPVPLHWTRYAWRWFNQAEVIAKELSKKSNKPVVALLERTRATKSQAGLPRNQRIKNLDNAFTLSKNAALYRGKKILLIDDVMTTGTTLYHCSKALMKIAPDSLIIGVACRTL